MPVSLTTHTPRGNWRRRAQFSHAIHARDAEVDKTRWLLMYNTRQFLATDTLGKEYYLKRMHELNALLVDAAAHTHPWEAAWDNDFKRDQDTLGLK